jgi:hypothetical protein
VISPIRTHDQLRPGGSERPPGLLEARVFLSLRKPSLLSVAPEPTKKPMRLPPPVPQSLGRAPGFVLKNNVSGSIAPQSAGRGPGAPRPPATALTPTRSLRRICHQCSRPASQPGHSALEALLFTHWARGLLEERQGLQDHAARQGEGRLPPSAALGVLYTVTNKLTLKCTHLNAEVHTLLPRMPPT